MRGTYIPVLVFLLYCGQTVFSKPTKFIAPMAFDSDYIQTATFITTRSVLTAFSANRHNIETVTIYFEVFNRYGKTLKFRKSKFTLKGYKPLMMITLPNHLLASRYIVPVHLTTETVITEQIFSRILMTVMGGFDLIGDNVSVAEGGIFCSPEPKPRTIDLGAPVTGNKRNKKYALLGIVHLIGTDRHLLRKTNNRQFVNRNVLRNIAADRQNDSIISNPKFMVPIRWEEDEPVYTSFFIHIRIGVTKRPKIDLKQVEKVIFYFNLLDESAIPKEINLRDLAVFDRDQLIVIILSTNILQEETQIIKPIQISDMDMNTNEGDFYLCGPHMDESTYRTFLTCDWIEEMDKNGVFESSKSTPTVADSVSIVVYRKKFNYINLYIAGITLGVIDTNKLSAIVTAEAPHYTSLMKFAAAMRSSKTDGDSVNVKTYKRFVDRFQVKQRRTMKMTTLCSMKAVLKGLENGMSPKSGLYISVVDMLNELNAIQNINEGLSSFFVTMDRLVAIKRASDSIKKFLFYETFMKSTENPES